MDKCSSTHLRTHFNQFSWNFDGDYCLQQIKITNFVSQKITVLHQTNKKECVLNEKYVHVLHSVLGSFCMNYCMQQNSGNQPVVLMSLLQ